MDRIALFLRGINLGKRRVKGAELEEALARAGFRGPRSYRASGNLVVDPPEVQGGEPGPGGEDSPVHDLAGLEARVEAAVLEGVGFAADAFARPLTELATLIDTEAILESESDGLTPHVIFLKSPLGRAPLEVLRGLETPDDRFPILGCEVVWLRRGRLSDSTIGPHEIERALGGAPNTMRKITTLRRMVRKFGG